jgi:hypothetical protein
VSWSVATKTEVLPWSGTPVTDKLEEISAGRKEAPAAGTGDVVAAEAGVADTRGEASVGQGCQGQGSSGSRD